jgi:hypothetical protein
MTLTESAQDLSFRKANRTWQGIGCIDLETPHLNDGLFNRVDFKFVTSTCVASTPSLASTMKSADNGGDLECVILPCLVEIDPKLEQCLPESRRRWPIRFEWRRKRDLQRVDNR